jgi:sec-independent protein translocase protein TatA
MNTAILALFNSFGPEWIVILLAIVLLFGGKKIPELMRGIGKGIREFNTARNSLENEFKQGMKESEQKEKQEK